MKQYMHSEYGIECIYCKMKKGGDEMNSSTRFEYIQYLKSMGYVNLYVRGGCKVPLEQAPDKYVWSMYNRVKGADNLSRYHFTKKRVPA